VYALSPLRVLSQTVLEHPAERQLIVNAPNWVAPAQADYALGHEGVEVMPAYVTPQLLAWTNTGIRASVDGAAFPNVFPQLDGLYFDAWGPAQDWESMAALAPGYDRVWLWEYGDATSALREVGAVSTGGLDPPANYLASFDGRVWLASASVEMSSGVARVELTWHSTAEAGEDVFAHVLACDGAVLGQRDGAALGGVYPLWLWPPSVTVVDVRHIPLARQPGGCYRVEIGLFDPADGARAPAFGADGARLANDALVIEPK
jgi:hypothetical protein